MRCAVIGMGRIGASVYQDLAPRLPSIIGLDIDGKRVAELAAQGFRVTTDFQDCTDIDVWIICTATGRNMETILSLGAALTPGPGSLVSVESTLLPGTMGDLAARFASRGFRAGQDFFLVHVPHRVMLGCDASTLSMPRVIGGITPHCLDKGMAFYRPLVSDLVPVTDIRVAELSKIVENSLRFVDIAFAETVAAICAAAQGLDFQSLRQAVNSKGNVRLLDVDYGIGGECLPKDIGFLNRVFPSPVLSGAVEADLRYREDLQGRALAAALAGGRSVLVDGVGYKPGIADLSFSRAVETAKSLQAAGARVFVYDPLFPDEVLKKEGLVPVATPEGPYDLIIRRGRFLTPQEAQEVRGMREVQEVHNWPES